MLRRYFPVAALIILLGSCVAPPAPPAAPPPPPPVVQAPVPPVSEDWRDWPVAQGDWSYAASSEGSIARFGISGRPSELTFRCIRVGRQIVVSRTVPNPVSGQMRVRTSYGVDEWPVAASAGQAVSSRAASDAALDRIAFSRGRFAIEVPGAGPLVVPAWAEPARVVEDCRS